MSRKEDGKLLYFQFGCEESLYFQCTVLELKVAVFLISLHNVVVFQIPLHNKTHFKENKKVNLRFLNTFSWRSIKHTAFDVSENSRESFLPRGLFLTNGSIQ